MRLDDARVSVVGLGASGLAALEVLAGLGARVRGYDAAEAAVDRAAAEIGPAATLRAVPDAEALADAVLTDTPDVVVVSPGVPATSPVLRRAEATAGLEVWSEVELAWRLRNTRGGVAAPWLTLTGTNGKTTTVGMLASILRAAGERAEAVGNVGTPVIRAVVGGELDVLAVELSSFQLHATRTVSPQASACLNLAPDHLDWHGSYAAYRDAKAKVYARTQVACVYNTGDAATRRMVEDADVVAGARAVGFTRRPPGPGEIGIVEDVLVDRAFPTPRRAQAHELGTLADLAHLAPVGAQVPPHVIDDALAAAALARAHGVPVEAVGEGLRAYTGGGHRIELVAVADDVRYVDDSKATNPHAAAASLRAVTGRCVWIAGGLAKGATFDELVAAHADRLRAAILIGVDRSPLRAALARHAADVPVVEVLPREDEGVMDRAVREAARLAHPGDTVLLAPAAASMDQFTDYAARGRAFARAARNLAEKGRST